MSEHETDPDDALVPPDLPSDAAADPETELRQLRAAPAAKTGAAAVTAGGELSQRELLRVLEKSGVTPFSSLGTLFDPEHHQAIARVPASGEPEMTVVGETARGYLLHGRA